MARQYPQQPPSVAAAARTLLRPRPAEWGKHSAALTAHLGSMTTADGTCMAYDSEERRALEQHAHIGLLAHLQGLIHCIRARGGAVSAGSRLEMYFTEDPSAEEAQIAAAQAQILSIPGTASLPELRIAVSIFQGQLVVDPTLCQLTLHGLHPRLARRGIGQLLLSMAGYEQQQYTVVGEIMGDLPFHYASQLAAAGVGNAYACLIYIRAPPLDAQLSRLPRSLFFSSFFL